MSEYLDTPITTTDDLAQILASFLVWIDHPGYRSDDQADYTGVALHYIGMRQMVTHVQPTGPIASWCDLCGMAFDRRPNYPLENWTGENFLWCPDCTTQQEIVRRQMGPERFRDLWRVQTEREAGIG